VSGRAMMLVSESYEPQDSGGLIFIKEVQH
jgi:hypothetical protein